MAEPSRSPALTCGPMQPSDFKTLWLTDHEVTGNRSTAALLNVEIPETLQTERIY